MCGHRHNQHFQRQELRFVLLGWIEKVSALRLVHKAVPILSLVLEQSPAPLTRLSTHANRDRLPRPNVQRLHAHPEAIFTRGSAHLGRSSSDSSNATSCIQCSAGTVCPPGASGCTTCPDGTTSRAGATSCTAVQCQR
ncbi:hypothetical protein B0H12DRAFT_1150624 [Mycena haematopus]|nr:hypothetical protein B0H12DRAFT_1150624 [Mycena haematopus]